MAAPWDDVGRAGNLLQLLGVDAFGLASMITQAALTARRNRDACLQLAEHVRVVEGLLRRLQMLPRLRQHPETRRPLEQLDDALRRAYLLVRSCSQEQAARSYLYQLLTGAQTAAKLRAAEEEIDRYIRLMPMIGLVATVRVEGPEEVLELDSEDSTPPPSPRLSLEEAPGSTAILVPTPTGDVPLPGIEGFEIVGEPKLGFTLRACGFTINGTTLCNFQWVRYLNDGTRQSIEGATIYDYVVTADDFDTVLAVECTPMDDNDLQGELLRTFVNGMNKIACDSDMQSEVDVCISNETALFNVFILREFSGDKWEPATVMLRRTGYQIILESTDEVVIEEEYSRTLQTKVPNGRSTQFVLVSSGGVRLLPFNTSGKTGPDNEDRDIRLRDLIVLVMRTFQKKALTLDAEEEGKS
ncbi:uncharacterized protein LOC133927286 [Phragmites australis]|uniref:uncharacterized protein LOC133927286 n=1 Tax=Phragmites australis TaxID=29695 RepID=UPI002D79007A|nr:uncharacterized protein LOC133927286 [Phragmites australis]